MRVRVRDAENMLVEEIRERINETDLRMCRTDDNINRKQS